MKATLDCLECIAKQALRAARVATDDPEVQRRILDDTVARIPAMDLNDSPASLSMVAYQLAARHTGQGDPYAALKRAQNDLALSLEAVMRERIQASPAPLSTALHLAAAGNVIDLGFSRPTRSTLSASLRRCSTSDSRSITPTRPGISGDVRGSAVPARQRRRNRVRQAPH